jgi:hypothetical protein
MLGDSALRRVGDFAPGFALGVQGAQAGDVDVDAASRQHRAKRVDQPQVAMVSRRGIDAAVGQPIADGKYHHRRVVDHRGLK